MSIDPDDIFNKLMALGPPNTISVPKAFRRIGALVDLASDLDKEDGIQRALEWCDDLTLLWQILRGNEALGIPESGFQ
jgi:hypothetical protein